MIGLLFTVPCIYENMRFVRLILLQQFLKLMTLDVNCNTNIEICNENVMIKVAFFIATAYNIFTVDDICREYRASRITA